MHCGSCDNIPFWKWLNENSRFPTSMTCNVYDGAYLSNVQTVHFTNCRVHKSAILTLSHTMHYEMNEGYKSCQKYVQFVVDTILKCLYIYFSVTICIGL